MSNDNDLDANSSTRMLTDHDMEQWIAEICRPLSDEEFERAAKDMQRRHTAKSKELYKKIIKT